MVNDDKLCVIIDDQLYMLKLPSHAPKNINLSYANSCVSEYLGSIYSLIDDIECITDNHKSFLKLIINERFKALFN